MAIAGKSGFRMSPSESAMPLSSDAFTYVMASASAMGPAENTAAATSNAGLGSTPGVKRLPGSRLLVQKLSAKQRKQKRSELNFQENALNDDELSESDNEYK